LFVQLGLSRDPYARGASALRPGQFIEARIAEGGTGAAFRIPRNALLRHKGKTWVLVAKEDGFQPLEVTLRNEEAGHLVIEGPLQVGDRVAVSGTAALVLPLSVLVTFIMMNHFGMSANLMSLGGLAIAIGMLVDAAVVVVENIVTHLGQGHASRLPRLHLIYRAVREVAVPVTSGILIIIIVFLPLLTLQGLEGKLFVPVALTIVFALSASLILSLTVIPVLASYLLGKVSHFATQRGRPVLSFGGRPFGGRASGPGRGHPGRHAARPGRGPGAGHHLRGRPAYPAGAQRPTEPA